MNNNQKQECYTCPTGATIFIPQNPDDISIVIKRSEGRTSPPFLVHNVGKAKVIYTISLMTPSQRRMYIDTDEKKAAIKPANAELLEILDLAKKQLGRSR